MEASKDELLITIELLNHFHNEVKKGCKSLEDLVKRGNLWIEEIKEKYNSEAIYSGVKDVLLQAIFKFKAESRISYNALIMKGGGIKGVAYVGALEELVKHYTFNWFAGTSAGAITAILLGAGYTVDELNTILSKKNFNDFKDANQIKALFNFITKKGFFEANTFNEWIEELLATKLNSAVSVEMRDLAYRTTVYASRKDKSVQIFDSHKADSQNTIAAFAARCSMSIPVFFTPQKIDGINIFDGGVKNNFPVDLILKDNEGTDFIGLYLGNVTYKQKKSSLLKDLFETWTESNEPDILRLYKEKIIIIDPSPISTLQFSLNSIEKEFLLESGRLAALNFLDKNKHLNKNLFNYEQRKFELTKIKRKLILLKKTKESIYVDFFFLLLISGVIWYKFLVELITC